MDKARKKELNEQFAQIKKYMGVYQITNDTNGKIFVGSNANLKNQWDRVKAALDTHMHVNAALQKDWNELGEGHFSFEILEEKEVTDKYIEYAEMLKNMARTTYSAAVYTQTTDVEGEVNAVAKIDDNANVAKPTGSVNLF